MSGRLAGQTAVITGGARGIGAGIAKRLAADGARIVLWDLDFAPFDAQAAGFTPALTEVVDVADPASVEAGAKRTLDAVGQVEILVNNAGISGPVRDALDYPLDLWERVLGINLTGVFLTCKALVPPMRARGYGRVVNISSIGGKEGVPGIAPYTASKAGVIGYTKSLARELAQTGVTANCIAPAMVETDLLKQMTPEHVEASRNKIPMGRFLTVKELADLVAWVASPECSFTTGFVFDATGGRADY